MAPYNAPDASPKGKIVSLASLFTIACLIILWKDRRDWFNYVVVALAAIFFAGTKWGSTVGPWLVARSNDIDGIIKNLFGVIDPMPLLYLLL